jgi:hypothetical protein
MTLRKEGMSGESECVILATEMLQHFALSHLIKAHNEESKKPQIL